MRAFTPRSWEIQRSFFSILATFALLYLVARLVDSGSVSRTEVVMISSLLIFIKELAGQLFESVLEVRRRRRLKAFIDAERVSINDGGHISHANVIAHMELASEFAGLDASSDDIEIIERLRRTYLKWQKNQNFSRYSRLPDAKRLELLTDFEALRQEMSK